MKTDFTARRVRLQPAVREIFEKKLAKLEKVLPSDAQAHVIVRSEKKSIVVEVTVVGRQRTWTATETGVDQETAAHAVMERIAAQAKKSKAKVKEEKKHHGSAARSPESWGPGDEPRDRRGVGPRRESIAARPMFEEDALTAFSGSSREVLVFRDPGNDAVRVLYRKRDGSLGLLIPT